MDINPKYRIPVSKPYLPKTKEEYDKWIAGVPCVTCKAGTHCPDYSETDKKECGGRYGSYTYDYQRHCSVERRFKEQFNKKEVKNG